jgi:acyl-CoA synthetase (AMP-forming)/AMP-acid ligase II
MPADANANANIARHLGTMAALQPGRAALKVPRGRTRAGDIDYLTLTFAELDAEVAAWGERLAAAGVRRGDRTLVMVRQGLPLIASVFALFRTGAVPVVIDPGMGLKSFLACVRHSRPRALVGIPLARVLSRVFRPSFTTVAVRVAASASLTARLTKPGSQRSALNAQLVNSATTDLAAVLFTSGSTGAPKGVCYEHGMFDAQVRLIQRAYEIAPGEIDLPLLPIFALFNPALGMTTIVPEIDPRHPAAVDPAKIVQAIRQENVTNSFGSPTLWRKIADHCLARGETLPSLRRVLCAGAPVPAALWDASRTFLPHGRLHSPYGATEALPVSTISSAEIAALHAADSDLRSPNSDLRIQGACVGRPVAEVDVRIITIDDRPIASLADARELPPGEIGEIIVRGPVVTKTYDARPDATAGAKISEHVSPGADLAFVSRSVPSPLAPRLSPDERGSAAPVWHRMGDCGYLDADGRLWFCGRKVERVETRDGPLFTEPVERVFRAHPRATRCALIGLGEPGHQRPALVVEVKLEDSAQCRALARELRALALAHPAAAAIKLFYFRPRFPVDVRHNAKIHRLALARWAATATGYESDPKR